MIAILATVVAIAATPADHAADTRELLRLGQQARTAHLSHDAALLVSSQADGFVSVSNGQVSRPAREEARAMFQKYFDGVNFKAWDDLAPPVITLSDDATLATVLVQKRVQLTRKTNPDGPITETDFAWLETWRKQGGVWRLHTIVSTNAPAKTIGG